MTVTEETNMHDSEPTIVESAEEAQFILEENPDAVILIRPKSVQF